MNDIAGIPLHKSFNFAVVEAGGYENMTCIQKVCQNYVEKVRRLRLGEGDVAAIQSYFSEAQARALRSKVEKEFQADFNSYSQMVPCATKYEMENRFQTVYTMSKFREFQDEITGKVYCDVVSALDGCSGKMYEVKEDVVYEEKARKKKIMLLFRAQECDIVCSCHLFEFRGIFCRHAISVLLRNDVTSIPDRYILRRWRRDVCRAHTRVVVNYDELVSSPSQMRYDSMCGEFATLANIVADDEE